MRPRLAPGSGKPRIWRVACLVVGGLVLVSCGGGEITEETAGDVAETVEAEWLQTPQEFRDRVGERFAFVCPPNGTLHNVWGTDVYTDDSSVCTAAVHAGKINVTDGGRVVIEMQEGQDSYTGSEANGVTTQDYAQWDGSFVLP